MTDTKNKTNKQTNKQNKQTKQTNKKQTSKDILEEGVNVLCIVCLLVARVTYKTEQFFG